VERIYGEGMSSPSFADSGIAEWVASMQVGEADEQPSVEDLRAGALARAAARPRGPELPEVQDLVLDTSLPLGARLYGHGTPRPLLVYFHGGGWAIGNLDTHDRICRRLATAADVAVLAVDYRLAPEHPWPAASDDAIAAYGWAIQNAKQLGVTSIGVAGDSAGGCLAALTCLRVRDAGGEQPTVQLLVYPNTDLTLSQPSISSKGSGFGVERAGLEFVIGNWVPDASQREHPRVSPLREQDLSGLAQAVVVTAEHDPLRDEGDAYAAALAAAGVEVTHRCEPGLVHSFLGLDLMSPAAALAADRIACDVATVLRQPT
jgi:acetyl esterase